MAKSKSFYDYFSENMEKVPPGLPAPRGLFGTVSTATASIGAMLKYVEKFGTSKTVAQMIVSLPRVAVAAGGGAVGFSAAGGEALLVVGACTAAYYLGACIGSLTIATGQYLSGGISVADCAHAAEVNGIETPNWLIIMLHTNPILLNPKEGLV